MSRLWVLAILLFLCTPFLKAEETAEEKLVKEAKTFQDEVVVPRDSEGVITGDGVRFDIPEDRKMYKVGPNVYRAEAKNDYTDRKVKETEERLNKRIDALEKRIAEIENQAATEEEGYDNATDGGEKHVS